MAGSSVNKVILVGNLGKDPEVRMMQNGREMATFTLATSESWFDKKTNDRNEKTEWHTVVIFVEGLVRVARDYLHKGSKVYLEGSLQTRKWTDQNSNDRYTTEVVLQGFSSTLVILDSKGASSLSSTSASTPNANSLTSAEKYDEFALAIDDDIPF